MENSSKSQDTRGATFATSLLGALFPWRNSSDSQGGSNHSSNTNSKMHRAALGTHDDPALLSRTFSEDSMSSPPDSASRRAGTAASSLIPTTRTPNAAASSTFMPLRRLAGSRTDVTTATTTASSSSTAATATATSTSGPGSSGPHGSPPHGHSNRSQESRPAASPTNQCAPLMRGYRQCLEVNPDAKVNCTWALDKYMKCQEMQEDN